MCCRIAVPEILLQLFGVCGRYAFSLRPGQVRDMTGSSPEPFPEPVFNQCPGRPVVSLGESGEWGFPEWGLQMPVAGGRKKWVINARSETAAEKRIFREGFALRRCVLPASGFYEWRRDAVGQPFYFFPREADGLLLGAVALEWEGGIRVVVLTRAADPWMAEIHHRAPVMIRPERLPDWMAPGRQGEEALRQCGFENQKGTLRRRPVSKRVNRVSENDADLLLPVEEERAPRQTELFD